MMSDFAAPADYGLRQTRTLLPLLYPLVIWLSVNKLKRVGGRHLGIQFLIITIVEKHGQAITCTHAKMVATVSTYLQRILQFPLVEVGFAPVTLDEDILRLHNALFGRDILNSLVLFAKPGHLCFTALAKIRDWMLGTVQEISTGRRNHEGDAFLVFPAPCAVSDSQPTR